MTSKIIKLMGLSLMSLTLLVGCNKPSNKITIPYGQLYDKNSLTNYVQIDNLDLEQKLDNKETFLLIVRGDSTSCLCWTDFVEAIKPFQQKANARFFLIDAKDVKEENIKKGIKPKLGGNYIYIIQNGTPSRSLFVEDGNPSFNKENPNTVEEWLDNNVSFTKTLYINKTQFENLFTQECEKEFTVTVTRNDCSDCKYILSSFLDKEVFNLTKTNYIFDIYCEGIYLCNGYTRKDADKPGDAGVCGRKAAETYFNFKNNYGLSNKLNKEFGYNNGYIPSLIHGISDKNKKPYECITDMCVYLNDTVEKNDDGTFKIVDSYYNGERKNNFLKNVKENNLTKIQNIDPKDIAEYKFTKDGETKYYYFWEKGPASKYHNKYLTAWFDTYCK